MSPELLNILATKELPVSNAQLVDYLAGKLSEEQNHEIESELLAGGSFEAEGLEGLLQLENKSTVAGLHHSIIQNLHDTIHPRKRSTIQRTLLPFSWIMLLVVGLLVVALAGWFLIWMLNNH